MPDALQIKGHTSTAPKPYVTGASVAADDPDVALDTALASEAQLARGSAAPDQQYGGPAHLQARIRRYDQAKQDAFAKKWNLLR